MLTPVAGNLRPDQSVSKSLVKHTRGVDDRRIISLLITLFWMSSGLSADRGWFHPRKAADVAQNHKLIFREPPKKMPGNVSVDAP